MLPPKKKPLATRPSPATSAPPRSIAPTPIAAERGALQPAPRGFPTALDAIRSPDVAAMVRRAVRAAACAGVVVSSAAALGGCHEPECVGSRVEELRIHGDQALEAALDLQLGASMDELGYGTGLASHPPYTTMPLAGAMPLPSYAFPLPEELPEQDVSETFEEGTDQTTPDSVE